MNKTAAAWLLVLAGAAGIHHAALASLVPPAPIDRAAAAAIEAADGTDATPRPSRADRVARADDANERWALFAGGLGVLVFVIRRRLGD